MKIERIILFTKGIETLSFFSEQLGKTFSKLGYEVFQLKARNQVNAPYPVPFLSFEKLR